MDVQSATHSELSPDTEAVLLLCSGLVGSGEAAPLSPAEYNRMTLWLAEKQCRPADLIEGSVVDDLSQGTDLPSPERVRALLGRGRLLGLALAKWADFGIWVMSRADPMYPERLRKLRAASPPLLFGAGRTNLLNQGGLAIVGSRDVDEDAVTFTREVASRCAEQQVQVISGGARGVDREALGATLEAGGKAIAVLVESLLKVITEGTARSGIHDGRLAVATPYDPEMGFTVGRAMARNKLIYALADYAVVVRFKTGEGGSWAGAVERLRHNQKNLDSVPMFVRTRNNPEEGCRKLQGMGAIPFPEETFRIGQIVDVLNASPSTLADLFNGDLASQPSVTVPVPTHQKGTAPNGEAGTSFEDKEVRPAFVASAPPVPAITDESDSCYNRCLNLLLEELRQQPSRKELSEMAKRLNLIPSQLNKLLDRAIAEGKVKKKKKGRMVVFVNASFAYQALLFHQSRKDG